MTRKPAPSEPPPTTLQIFWGHPLAAPFFSKSSPLDGSVVGTCWNLLEVWLCREQRLIILQYLTITNQYPSSTRFMLVNLSVDAQVHGRNHCIWSTSALCADLLGILGCFHLFSRCLFSVCYNQCLPCNQINQVLQSRWKIRGQNSGTHRCTNECRQTNAAAKLHNSFATPLVLRLCQKSKKKTKHIQKYSKHISSLQATFRKAVGKTMKNKTVTRKT